MRKTIWYITKYFSPRTEKSAGGRDWFLLTRMAESGNLIRVITSDSNTAFDIPKIKGAFAVDYYDNLQVIWLRTLKYKVAKSVLRILSWFHFEWRLFWLDKSSLPRPDVIIVSSLSLLTIINGLFLKRKYKCKLVFEVRDIWPLTIIVEGGYSRNNPFVVFLSWLEWLGYRYSDVVVGTMPNLSQHVEKVLGYKRVVQCVPMGFDESMLEAHFPVEKSFIDAYFHPDKFSVVYAGTIGITNALEPLFEAAKKLQGNNRIQFVLIGDGPLRENYKEKYSGLSNVLFAGKVPRRMVRSVLEHADVVYFSVFRSRVWDYGQSLNKVIDYMLSGKPILASFSGYSSMINESGCGYIVPAEDVEKLVDKLEIISQLPRSELSEVGLRGARWIYENRPYSKLASDYLSYIFPDDVLS